MQELDYWSRRFGELYPNGLTQEEADEANAEIWKNCYPTREMQKEAEAGQAVKFALFLMSCYTCDKTA